MREIVSINIGKTGVESGISSQELYNGELNLPPNGLLDLNTVHPSQVPQIPVFYSEIAPTSLGELPKYVPRSIFADMDQTTIDNLRVSHWRHLLPKNQLLSGIEDTGGNYAKGYFTTGKEFFDLLEDRVRKMAEDCSNIEGFTIQSGIGGGTGTGLTQRLLEHIITKYPKAVKLVLGVYPTHLLSKMIAEPYNVVLGTHALCQNADVVVVFDNEAIFDINQRLLGVSLPRYIDIDRIIAYAMRGITAPLRYSIASGLGCQSLTHIKSNMVPFPGMHFLTPGCAPISSSNMHIPMGGGGVPESSWLDAFKPSNLLIKSSSSYEDSQNGKYLASALTAQGENINEENIRSSIEHLGR